MKHSCSRCGKPVSLEKASGGVQAYQCSWCNKVGVIEAPTRTSKYGNQRVETPEGEKFDSKAEASRWQELKLMEKAGEIRELQRQVTYSLDVNGVHITTYRADFVYVKRDEFVVTVEDVKGRPNDRWPMKKRLMLACHEIDILETGTNSK